MATIELNDFQQAAMAVPEDFDLFLGGGRGGGKSYAMALLALRHAEQYEGRARILYIRRVAIFATVLQALTEYNTLLYSIFSQTIIALKRYHIGQLHHSCF